MIPYEPLQVCPWFWTTLKHPESLNCASLAKYFQKGPLYIFVPETVHDGIEEGRDDIVEEGQLPVSLRVIPGPRPHVHDHGWPIKHGDHSDVGSTRGKGFDSPLGCTDAQGGGKEANIGGWDEGEWDQKQDEAPNKVQPVTEGCVCTSQLQVFKD